MSDKPNRQAVVVGLFVSFAALVLIGGILTVGDINSTFTRTISVSTVFDEVEGLQTGANVWFSGVKVGTVKELGFEDGSKVGIELSIDRNAAAFIPEDALAKIGSDGLIGSKLVVLYDGTPGGPPITDGDVLLAGEGVSIEDMKAMLQENNANMLAITTDLKAITARIAAGEGNVGKLLGGEELYTKLDATMSSLETASVSAKSMTGSMATFSAKLNREGSLPNELVTDEVLFASITKSAESLEKTAADASALVAGLEKGITNPDSAVGTLLHDEGAGADLEATLANLNEGSRLLSEDLEAMQHHFLFRGAFKRKDKADKEEEKQRGTEPRSEPEPEPAPAPKPPVSSTN